MSKIAKIIIADEQLPKHVRILRFENIASMYELPSLYLAIYPHMYMNLRGQLHIQYTKEMCGVITDTSRLMLMSDFYELKNIMKQCGDNLTAINRANFEQPKKVRSIKI
jgi:hypothetical protein